MLMTYIVQVATTKTKINFSFDLKRTAKFAMHSEASSLQLQQVLKLLEVKFEFINSQNLQDVSIECLNSVTFS